jgi:hypothetical protein
MPFEINEKAWDDIAKAVVTEKCVPMCQRIADASNKAMAERVPEVDPDRPGVNEPGYIVGVEGGKPLKKHDYRSTVMTATNQAMVDNAEHNTLIQNMQEAAE